MEVEEFFFMEEQRKQSDEERNVCEADTEKKEA